MRLRMVANPDSQSDEQLLELIARQDKLALERLYQRYRQPLGAFLHRKLYDKSLTDEVFNDILFTIWQKAANFRGDSKASTWIFGVAYRVILSASRREVKHKENRSDIEPSDFEKHMPQASVESTDPMAEKLEQAITQLSDKHKTVIELTYYHEMSLEQISNITDAPINTVKTRLFHARQALKKILA